MERPLKTLLGEIASPPSGILVLALVVLVLLVLVGVVWALVSWRRKRAPSAPAKPRGPSVARRLRALWQPFYDHLPRRALHFPTVVVVGDTGVGKTQAIERQVDWRGQAHQFLAKVPEPGLLQLYLGPDVVAHELSAPLLRDVSRSAKRGLERLWANMGPSATVVVVLDARTLTTTPPEALRELAHLVRGKIGLFPRRCQADVELRVLLTHLDQIDGYDEFAVSLGIHHGPLDLGLLGSEYTDANRLVAAYDGHLAYALTKHDGEAFDRLIRFYGLLPGLLGSLQTLLVSLEGRGDPYGEQRRLGGLYFGGLVPCSQVGNPFEVEHAQIATSIDRHNHRGFSGGMVTAVGLMLIAGALFTTHGVKIARAKTAVDNFTKDHQTAPGTLKVKLAKNVAQEVAAMRDSENVWLSHTFKKRKKQIGEGYEKEIREGLLFPLLKNAGRIRSLYLLALIYASQENTLGKELVLHNLDLWAHELMLDPEVIRSYVEVSDTDFTEMGVPACKVESGIGAEWSEYLVELSHRLEQQTLGVEEMERLRAGIPDLRSSREYVVLGDARNLLLSSKTFESRHGRSELPSSCQDLLSRPLDHWPELEHAALQWLSALLREHLPQALGEEDTSGWGLAELVTALRRPSPKIDGELTIAVEVANEKRLIHISGPRLAEMLTRFRTHTLIEQVFAGLDARRSTSTFEPCSDGKEFFSADFKSGGIGKLGSHGGGPKATLDGRHTRASFERVVAPVLRFASERLRPQLETRDEVMLAAFERTLIHDDARALEERIACAAEEYAREYRDELFEYYRSFELGSISDLALPFALKGFVEPRSWFTSFLRTVAEQATPTLTAGNPYFEPMREALDAFAPLVELSTEDKGAIPGLEPYQALLAQVLPALDEGGRAALPGAPELRARLSATGALTLDALRGGATPHDTQVRLWLISAGLDDEAWHEPFLAPIREMHELGLRDLQSKLTSAWTQEVRPLVRPLLQKYPFNPTAGVDTDIAELEALVRKQGKEPGAIWLTFERLLGPVTVRRNGELAMLAGLQAPPGMIGLMEDLERMSQMLWDPSGARVPLKIAIKPLALPKEAHDGRTAAMAYVRGGERTVYAFNQRPEAQTLELEWWNQDTSVVSLELRSAFGNDPRSYALEEDGSFSFYRLLDRAKNADAAGRRATLTEMAIDAATRCSHRDARGAKNITIEWRVPVGRAARAVKAVLVSDPWAPFAVRDCG